MRLSLLAVCLAVIVLPTIARAEDPIETYQARLSNADHHAPTGARLTSVAEILRQDRENIYKFDARDPGDQTDAFFASDNNRARMEDLLIRGRISAATTQEILYGAPLVEVLVYRNHIDVKLKSAD